MRGFDGPYAAALTTLFLCAFILGLAQLGHCQIATQDTVAPAVNAFDGLFTPRFALPAPDRKYADWFSTGTAAASLLKDAYDAWQAPNRKDALVRLTARDGGAVLAAELLKRVVHRTRPDGSDAYSWPSEHTMLSILLASQCGGGGPGPGFSLSIPLVFGTGAGRIMADKHFASDVLSGAGLGWLIGHYTRGRC